MKKRLIILILTGLFIAPAYAELTVKDTTSREYLKNQGYSEVFINSAQKSAARANGEPLAEPIEKEYYNQPVVKAVRKFFMYIDPALDDHSFMNDHNIHPAANYEDL